MAGHVWQLDEDGYVEYFGDLHAGPLCVVCDDYDCIGCNPAFTASECLERTAQPTLPGLDYEEV